MVANVPLWVTCAVLSNVLGLAFALTALGRLGWRPTERLQRMICCWKKKGTESSVLGLFHSDAVANGRENNGNAEAKLGSNGKGTAVTVEDGKPSSSLPSTTTSGLSLAFLRARARAASGITKDDADSGSQQEFCGGVLSQPWQRGCACEVRRGSWRGEEDGERERSH